MKQHNLFTYIKLCVLIVCLGLLVSSATLGPQTYGPQDSQKFKPKSDPPVRILPESDAVGNLKDAEVLLARYEKELPGAKSSRGEILAALARLCYILGEWGGWKEKSECRKYFIRGRDYAEILCREAPQRVEGHYWLARNLCGLAQTDGSGQALKLVPVIALKLEVAEKLNRSYNQAGPLRILGRLYHQAPAWPLSVGDLPKALENLHAAAELAPENSTNHLYLAEALLDSGQSGRACPELEKVLKSTVRANWAPGLKDDHQRAVQLLAEKCKIKVNLYSLKD